MFSILALMKINSTSSSSNGSGGMKRLLLPRSHFLIRSSLPFILLTSNGLRWNERGRALVTAVYKVVAAFLNSIDRIFFSLSSLP